MEALRMNKETLWHRLWAWWQQLRHGGHGLYYIHSSEVLPPPLTPLQEEELFRGLEAGDGSCRQKLIVHNLRLVVYIAKRFEANSATSNLTVEDAISIGTIGLIKAVNTFVPSKKIKLATYASRCIENEILMYLRKSSNRRQEASIDEPLNVDGDGNELLLSDILGSDANAVSQQLEQDAERAESELPRREPDDDQAGRDDQADDDDEQHQHAELFRGIDFLCHGKHLFYSNCVFAIVVISI